MKCVLIVTPGRETCQGVSRMCQLGYWVELYRAATKDEMSCLTDELREEAVKYRGFDDTKRDYVRPLRASWVKLLEDEHYKLNNDIIFCENDALPLIDEKALKLLLDTIPSGGDVYKLNFKLTYTSTFEDKLPYSRFNNVSWIDLKEHCKANGNEVWGTHALYIPTHARKKVAKLFREAPIPVDDALNFAAENDLLKVYIPSVDLFLQIGERIKPKDKKFALLLSSYRRYKDMQRQIYAMMDQSYKNLTLFVAAKGIAEADIKERLLPLFQHFIDEGRLVIRSFPNSNQVTNFVDCYRGLDMSEYDLFAKIDDDDVYPRDYFEKINELHRHLLNDVGSWNTWFGGFIRQQAGYPVVTNKWVHYVGATLIMPWTLIATIAKYENNPKAIAEFLQDDEFSTDTFGHREDYIMEQLLIKTGGVQREHWYPASPEHCSCHANASVTRRGQQDYAHYWELLRSVHNNRAYEFIIRCYKGNEAYLRIVKDKAWTLDGEWTCYDVIEFNDEILILRTDKNEEMKFEKNEAGTFVSV